MKKHICLLLCTLMMTFICVACSVGTQISQPTAEVTAKPPVPTVPATPTLLDAEEPEPSPDTIAETNFLYVGGAVYDDISFTVQNGTFFEDQRDKYFLTAGGSFNFPNGSNLWAGSTLSAELIMGTNEYANCALVAFSYETELSDETLTKALEQFAAEISLFDGAAMLKPIRQLYAEGVVCLLFDTKALQEKEVWFRIGGEDNKMVLAVQ